MTNCFDGRNMHAPNKSGRAGEQAAECVAGLLTSLGYTVTRQHAIKHVIADLFVRGILEYPNGLIISVKTQFSKGTAEQKLLHEMMTLHKTGLPSFVLLIGNGWTSSLVNTYDAQRNWAYQNVKGLFRSLDEFLQWSKDLPGTISNYHETNGFSLDDQLSLFDYIDTALSP